MILFLASFFISIANAGQLVPRWALERNAVSEGAGNAERLYGVEYLHPLGEAMRIKGEVGGWTSRQSDRESSFYTSVSWGFCALMTFGLFFDAYVGPAWISQTDSRNGSHFEIKHDLGVGWMTAQGWGVGLGYSHLSNAGIVQPNLGRDFLGMRFFIPLSKRAD